MTTHSDNISQELLNNSKKDKSHAQFFLKDNTSFIDLRLASERPFWGHTHPLIVQNQFGKLDHIEQDHHFFYKIDDFNNLLNQAVSISEYENEKFIIITELDILFHSDLIQSKLDKIKENDSTIIEQDLYLFTDHSLFYFDQDFKIISYSHIFKHFITNFEMEKSFQSKAPLESNFIRYFDYILSYNGHSKFKLDRELINTSHLNPTKNYLYFQISKIQEQKLNESKILYNKYKDYAVMSFPVSCTKQEILDTLEVINKAIGN